MQKEKAVRVGLSFTAGQIKFLEGKKALAGVRSLAGFCYAALCETYPELRSVTASKDPDQVELWDNIEMPARRSRPGRAKAPPAKRKGTAPAPKGARTPKKPRARPKKGR